MRCASTLRPVTHVIAPKSGVQHICHGYHGHIAAAVVVFVIGISTISPLEVIAMSFVGFCGVCVITINVHLSLWRSVFLIIRRRIPLFDLKAPREDPTAHYVITLERVPLV